MPIRITGMNSGLDTDSIVKELVSAYSTKKDDIVKQKTKHEWKQEAWKELNTKIYSFYTSLDSMRFSNNYGLKKTTVSDTSKASITAQSSAVIGSQTLEILETAKTSYWTGDKVSEDGSITNKSTLADLGVNTSGSFTLKVGEKETNISLNSNSTISDVLTQLNDAGINASFDEKNQRLFLNAKESGKDYDIDIVANDDAGQKIVDKLGLGAGAAKIKGENAKIKLNNATFESNTNSFTINGLTITTLEKTNGAISINTTTDNQAIYDKIKNFIKGYNELIKEMDKLYNADSAKGYEPLTDDEKDEMSDEEVEKWETKIKDAILRRDQTLSSVSSVMKNAMSVSINIGDKSYNLSMFGIKTGGYFTAEKNEKSMYHIDGNKDDSSSASSTDKLMAAISSDPDGVAEFFSKLSQNVYDALDKKMKSTTLSSAYKVYNDKQMDKDYKNYEKSIAEWEEKVQYYEDYYYKKFSEMETALGKLQSSQSSLSNLLGM